MIAELCEIVLDTRREALDALWLEDNSGIVGGLVGRIRRRLQLFVARDGIRCCAGAERIGNTTNSTSGSAAKSPAHRRALGAVLEPAFAAAEAVGAACSRPHADSAWYCARHRP